MAGESIQVGDLRIIALSDTVWDVDLSTFIPTPGPGDWAEYPEFVDEHGEHRHPFNMGSYLVVSDSYKLIVDTGAGPVGPPPFEELRGSLIPNMREQCGFGPEDVDFVFATHMHFDHIGWHVTRGDDGEPRATFPNARYFIPKVDWDTVFDPTLPTTGPHSRDYSEHAGEILEMSLPYAEDIKRVIEVETTLGGQTLTDEIVTVDTPGHTPGHQSLMLDSGGERLYILGDVIHLPVQVPEPGRVMSADVHPQLAVRTRTETVEWLEREGLMAAIGHFPDPGFGHVVRGTGKRYWRGLG